MSPARLSTADYPADARNRLATAVQRARDTAGNWSQQQLADLANVSKRSIVYLEKADPRVGRRVLEAIGRALPGWDVDTARRVLEGAQPPNAGEPQPEEELEPAPGTGSITDEEQALVDVLIEREWSAQEIARAIDTLRRRKGGVPDVGGRSGTDH